MENYYKKELNKIKPDSRITFKFYGTGDETKNLNLNRDSAKELKEFLETYLINDDLLQYIKDNNIPFSNHCSDLYIYVNDITQNIINKYKYKCNVTTFISQTDNKKMFEIPFGYTDYKKQSVSLMNKINKIIEQ